MKNIVFLVYLSLSSTKISTDCWCQLVNIPPVDINFGCSDRLSVCALHKSTNRYVVYTVDFYILYFVARYPSVRKLCSLLVTSILQGFIQKKNTSYD